MGDRDRHQGDYDRSRPWDLGQRRDNNGDEVRSGRGEQAQFGQGGGRGQDVNRGFGESGGYGAQGYEASYSDQGGRSGFSRDDGSFGGSGYNEMDRGQTRFGGSEYTAQNYGRGLEEQRHEGWREGGHERHGGAGGHVRQTEHRRFGQSGQAGFGQSDYAHGLSQSAGYGQTALGSSRVGYSAQGGSNPGGYGGYGREGYGGGTTSMGQGQRTAGGYNQQYGRAYGQGQNESHGGGYGASGSQGYGQPQGQGPGGYPGTQYSGGPSGGGAVQPRGGQASGADVGFGQGGAFQQGWGGQSDSQRKELEHHDQGGGTYGQHDYNPAARRSEYRDAQRYSGGMHQNQSGSEGYTGFSGYGGPANPLDHNADHDHEPDYVHWKSQRLSDLDREHHEKRTAHERELDDHYRQFREHKRTRFHNEFEDWRIKQAGQAKSFNEPDGNRNTVQTGSGTNIGGATTAMSQDDERVKSTSSPGGDRTDMSGVGDHGTAVGQGSTSATDVMAGGGSTGGGAGMRGAGAAGGSSATMATGTASSGDVVAGQTGSANTSGVTIGSEDKKKH